MVTIMEPWPMIVTRPNIINIRQEMTCSSVLLNIRCGRCCSLEMQEVLYGGVSVPLLGDVIKQDKFASGISSKSLATLALVSMKCLVAFAMLLTVVDCSKLPVILAMIETVVDCNESRVILAKLLPVLVLIILG
jgi:hypothetical protein